MNLRQHRIAVQKALRRRFGIGRGTKAILHALLALIGLAVLSLRELRAIRRALRPRPGVTTAVGLSARLVSKHPHSHGRISP